VNVSVFDLYTIGIGPSSSHVVGPMRAAYHFAAGLRRGETLAQTRRVRVELYGSLAFTGRGHGTDRAVVFGLAGERPEGIDPDTMDARLATMRVQRELQLMGTHPVPFHLEQDLIFREDRVLPRHSNGMEFSAVGDDGATLAHDVYYSVGGGFIVREGESAPPVSAPVPFPFWSAEEILRLCAAHDRSISSLIMENEKTFRTEGEIRRELLHIWEVMQECVVRGLTREGMLPGGLSIARRAPQIHRDLVAHPERALRDPLSILDWVNLYALAVNEENASGGRVVTAPTNGAAGILPAVLHYYQRFCPAAGEDGIIRFLLTAGAIALLYKQNASLSGAEVGCQGEVGVACSMAAGGLAAALGGTPGQVENAAEIGMEHNLGLTCDPIGGLVQIPCIERNAMGAIKAINASRIALRGDGSHKVSLDQVIATMRETGFDMQSRYKETSQGGLAVNVIEC
jgi:L-serine dehydratase